MSGYADMYKDQRQAEWLNRWVPLDDEWLLRCPKSFREQYRFTLAQKREAEATVEQRRSALKAFKAILREV